MVTPGSFREKGLCTSSLLRCTAFVFLIKRFNNLVDNFNLLSGKVTQLESRSMTPDDLSNTSPSPSVASTQSSLDRAKVALAPNERVVLRHNKDVTPSPQRMVASFVPISIPLQLLGALRL